MRRLSAILLGIVWLFPLAVASAEADVGIVFIHAKWAQAYGTNLSILMSEAKSRGYKVTAPTMPWSSARMYDADYPQALAELEAAVQELRGQGAKRVVLAGHSFGANAVLAYAGAGKDIDGILAIAPGHAPDRDTFRRELGHYVEKARQMIAAGEGESKAFFMDLNQGKTISVQTTAAIYFSFFDPEGLGAMPKSASRIPRPVPFLWVIGQSDILYPAGEDYAFTKAPKHEASRYLVVTGGHRDTPTIAMSQILEWLVSLQY